MHLFELVVQKFELLRIIDQTNTKTNFLIQEWLRLGSREKKTFTDTLGITANNRSYSGPQRENFPGGTKVDTGPQILLGTPSLIGGPMPLNHFLSDVCRSSFKSEGKTIFAYS